MTDYLALLPADSSTSAPPLSRDDAEQGRQYWSYVNATIRQAAARAKVVFADVASISAPHHAWSTDPWLERFVLLGGKAAPYHPLRSGMVAVADALEAALRSA